MIENTNESLDVAFGQSNIAHMPSIPEQLERAGYSRAWVTETIDQGDKIEISSWVPSGIPLHIDCAWSDSTDFNLVLLRYFGRSGEHHRSRLYCVSGIPPMQDYDAAYPWPKGDSDAEDA